MLSRITKIILIISAVLVMTVGATGAYFSDTKVISGNVFSTGTWSNLVINEVYFNLAEEHGREGKNEWIEIYNNGTEPINLKGYALQSTMGYFPITTNAVWIPPKGFALVSHDAQTWKIWEISKETPTVNLPGNYAKADWLLAGGDCLYLKDNSAEVVDEVCWGGDVPAGSSYSRITPGSFEGWITKTPDPGF